MSDNSPVSNFGSVWTNEELALLYLRSKTLSLSRLSLLHGRTSVAILFQLLKRGKLAVCHGASSSLPEGALVGFKTTTHGVRFNLAQDDWTDKQEQELQASLDQEPTFSRLMQDTNRRPTPLLSKLFESHRLVLTDGYDLGVETEFFAVLFLLPPRTYKPWLDGSYEMLDIVEITSRGTTSFIARPHTPTKEQRDQTDREASDPDFVDAWGEVCNEDLIREQRQDLTAYLKDSF